VRDTTRLRLIVAELWAFSDDVTNFAPATYAKTAGDLILEAYALGAFDRDTPAFHQLRARLRLQQVNFDGNDGTKGACPRIGAFMEAIHGLTPQCREEKDWGEACRRIAHTIELEVDRIDNEKGTGGAGAATPPADAKGKGEGSGGASSAPRQPRSTKPADNTPKRGRPVGKTTIQRADFAKPLREQAKTWPEIYALYVKKYPRDINASADTIRLAFERQFPEPK